MENFLREKLPIFFMFFLILLSSPAMPKVRAQPSSNDDPQAAYANFKPSMAIIIVVLVAALFFMGFFSVYIRHCSDPNSANSVRNVLSMRPRRGNAASRGLEQSVIETFPMFSYADVKDHKIGKGALECAVCLNEFEDDETLRLIPKCDHVFHPECIDAWLESHVTCPVCRANLTPQPGDESYHMPDFINQENREDNSEPQRTDDVTVQVVCDDPPEQQETVRPQMNRNISFDSNRPRPQMNRNISFDSNRPPRDGSIRRGRGIFGFGRFRSHSTGHYVVQPGENVDRFTLRLPEEKRKEMMNRALMNRTKSYAAHLPRDRSSRRGYRIGGGEGSNKGTRFFGGIEPVDRAAQSDRWIFARTPSFFSRVLSIRSPRVTAENNEGSTSKSVKTVKMPSFKHMETNGVDETGSGSTDSVRPPI